MRLRERGLAFALAAWLAITVAACREEPVAGSGDTPVRPSGDLVAVAWADETRVLVASASGGLFVGTERGERWQRARLPAAETLRAVAMADARHGWGVGPGTLLRTEDGGATWRRQRLPGPAARMRLTDVAAIDARRAIAVGPDGLRLWTQDGGARWQGATGHGADPQQATSDAGSAAHVACLGDAPGTRACWVAGGDGLLESIDDGVHWRPVDLLPVVVPEDGEFEHGRVVVPDATAAAWRTLLAGLRTRDDLRFRIEAGLSRLELERIGHEGDAEALFELVDARLEELRGVLESAGLAGDRIEREAGPPWHYADSLDEDPHRLERYWEGRIALGARGRVRLVESPVLHDLTAARSASGAPVVVGVGERAKIVEGPGPSSEASRDERAWRVVPGPPSPHALLGGSLGAAGLIAVGEQGQLWRQASEPPGWLRPEVGAAFFEPLRAVAFSPSGAAGLAVGDGGRLLRSLDGGASWSFVPSPAGAPVDSDPQGGHSRIR